MRRFLAYFTLISVSTLITGSVLALDPVAPRAFRKSGMIWVKTPNPATDVVEITRLKTGTTRTIPSDKVEVVPVGKYQVNVKMQNYNYTQKVLVEPTERTDVEVPGYGNLQVNSKFPGEVVVYRQGTGTKVATFATNEVKTLPRGRYDVKVLLGKAKGSVMDDDVWVVTNTTRILDVDIARALVP